MDLEALASQLDGQSATAGWDAVCAINVANMNQLFLRWYLTNGPTNPDEPVQLIFQAGTSWYLLDAMLGPPEISFKAGGGIQEGQVSMIVVSGTLLAFDPAHSVIQNALILQPDVASVSGTVDLSKTGGVATLGEVVLDLGSGAYTPAISGVEATSLQATALGSALKEFFASHGIRFRLGGVTTAEVPVCLQPRFFEFVVQPNPEQSGDGCVLLLIQTSGSRGVVGQLASYPIPAGSTAALMVSNRVLFNELFPAQLTNTNTGVTFSGSASNGAYRTVVTAGSVDLGVLSYDSAPGRPYSSNGKFEHFWSTGHETAEVVIFFEGLTLSANGGKLAASYGKSWTQGWAYINQSGLGPSFPGDSYETASTTLSYNATAPVTVKEPSTCVVTFPWSGPPTCKSDLNKNLLGGFGQVDPGDLIVQNVVGQLTPVFSAMTVADVDTFALQNLLFYPNQSLTLPDGSLTGDLLLVGSVVPMLLISPASVALAPGSLPQHFTATLNGRTPSNLVWEISPKVGTIDSTSGVYTPPAAVPRPKAVIVTATDGDDSGSALVLLYHPQPSAGLVVGPPTLTLTAGQTFDLTVTDSSGATPSVTWTIDPPSPDGGTMSDVFGTWQYTAPSNVTTMTPVTLKATSTSNAEEYGTATLTLVPTAAVTVSPASSTISPGHTVELTAEAPAVVPELAWLVHPSGTGTIQAGGPGMRAVYTAPTTLTQARTVQIVAYGVGGSASAAGIGIASVTINPSTG